MNVLGISCDFHDAAAAVIIDGRVVAAAEQERFSRIKHDAELPAEAIASCLATAGIEAAAIDAVVFHEKPMVAMSRQLATRRRQGPSGVRRFVLETPKLFRTNLMIAQRVDDLLRRLGHPHPPRLSYAEHHLSHAAAAFYPSPFEQAAIVTIDGIGEWSSASIAHGVRHRIDLLEEQRFPNSLGLLYSLVTLWCGFRPNDGEYKVMGLAPYGEPSYRDALDELVMVHPDGSVQVDDRRLRWWSDAAAGSRSLAQLLGGPPRGADDPIGPREQDLARSVQELTEDVVLAMAEHAHRITGAEDVCLAGGVALNCVANGRLLREGPFADVWVQPAAGDAGSAIGAALWWWHGDQEHHRADRDPRAGACDGMSGAALGPAFTDGEIEGLLVELGLPIEPLDDDVLLDRAVALLAGGAAIGWFDGRMEFGPRALGHRSILADPRSATMQAHLNERIKERESFRPFAPAVLWEHATEWFDLDRPSPYMLFTARARDDRLPACTHVDGSARVQTVHRETHPRFHALLRRFHDVTGCPVLLNTSFNVAGQPIVCTPDEAISTAARAGLDALVLGPYLLDAGDLR